ncbi:MAG: response regulator [Phycisphaerae bacterium]|jgi:two-component system chemotaxis response regulator CheY|nr:MAG: response regulator [Phycisphaerae bacterium]
MAYRFLIVDDSATTRAVIRRTLGICGVEVEKISEAGNGRDALAMLRVGKFDMVFLDLNMPEMSGVEVTEKLRQDPKLAGVNICVVSSESMESRVQQLRSTGVQGYIKKPFTPEQIRQVIQDVLGVAHAA